MIKEVIDQRDVQKLGGLCTRYPSSYIVCNILKKHGIKRIVDVTYGRGRFYKLCRDELEIIASDPKKWEWIEEPDKFYRLTVWQLYNSVKNGDIQLRNIDCIVIDPPAWTGNRYRKREEFAYIIGTPYLIIKYGIKLAKLIDSKHVFLHFNKVPCQEAVKHLVEFKYYARYLYTKNKNTSYYILYETNKMKE